MTGSLRCSQNSKEWREREGMRLEGHRGNGVCVCIQRENPLGLCSHNKDHSSE